MSAEELIEHATSKVETLVDGQHVLAIQDTTELNYQAHAGRTQGLGTVGNGTDAGLFLHPMLTLNAEDGSCLGLSAIHPWLRHEGAADNYPSIPIEEKESYRWLSVAEAAKKRLTKASMITIIADRESDIYEEWARIPDEKTHLLTRVCHDRRINQEVKLYAYTDNLPVEETFALELPARPGKRQARTATMAVRFSRILIKRPQKTGKEYPSQLELSVVDVRETTPELPKNESPVHWRLLTTHSISNTAQAREIIEWYRQRWQIEQLFRTLKKQGLNIESSQLETAEGLIKLSILALQAAVKSLQLTLSRNGTNKRLASDVFDDEQISVLKALQSKLEGKTAKQKNPHTQGQLSWAAWIIARLGGWKGYKSESPPGPITMIRGLNEFDAMLRGWKLANLCA